MLRIFAISCVTAAAAAAVSVPAATPALPCSERLIADWSADSRLDGAYHLGCYQDALDTLPEDLRTYSSAPDDIGAALQRRVHQLESRPARAAPGLPAAGASSDGNHRLLALVLVTLLAGAAVLVAGSRRRVRSASGYADPRSGLGRLPERPRPRRPHDGGRRRDPLRRGGTSR